MHKIAIEEHFLLRELGDYFHTHVKGVSNESFDKIFPKFWDLDVDSIHQTTEREIECCSRHFTAGFVMRWGRSRSSPTCLAARFQATGTTDTGRSPASTSRSWNRVGSFQCTSIGTTKLYRT